MKTTLLKSFASASLSMLFLLNISACATLNESECKTANWEIIGMEDGSQGRNTSYIGEHRQACAEYGVSPDLKAYLDGHAKGLQQFCTEQNGYNQGFAGRSENQVCPANLAKSFNRGYRQGYRVYKAGLEVNKLGRAIDSHNQRLHEIGELKKQWEDELVKDTTREYRRRELLEDIKELERETESIYHELDEMNYQLENLQKRYQRLLNQRN